MKCLSFSLPKIGTLSCNLQEWPQATGEPSERPTGFVDDFNYGLFTFTLHGNGNIRASTSFTMRVGPRIAPVVR